MCSPGWLEAEVFARLPEARNDRTGAELVALLKRLRRCEGLPGMTQETASAVVCGQAIVATDYLDCSGDCSISEVITESLRKCPSTFLARNYGVENYINNTLERKCQFRKEKRTATAALAVGAVSTAIGLGLLINGAFFYSRYHEPHSLSDLTPTMMMTCEFGGVAGDPCGSYPSQTGSIISLTLGVGLTALGIGALTAGAVKTVKQNRRLRHAPN